MKRVAYTVLCLGCGKELATGEIDLDNPFAQKTEGWCDECAPKTPMITNSKPKESEK